MSTNSVVSPVPSNTVNPKRYHPALVFLHWFIALLIFGAFFLAKGSESEREGFRPGQQGNLAQNVQLSNRPQGFTPQAIQNAFSAIGWHMIVGISVLVLLIIRVLLRFATRHPEWQSTGIRLFDWVGNFTHLGLYLLTFAMVITGIFLADRRGLLSRTFGIGSAPGAFGRGFSIGRFHEAVWFLLILLIVLHVGAALYHQFILKDNLSGRMWFGKDIE